MHKNETGESLKGMITEMKEKLLAAVATEIALKANKTKAHAKQYAYAKGFIKISTPGRPTIWMK